MNFSVIHAASNPTPHSAPVSYRLDAATLLAHRARTLSSSASPSRASPSKSPALGLSRLSSPHCAVSARGNTPPPLSRIESRLLHQGSLSPTFVTPASRERESVSPLSGAGLSDASSSSPSARFSTAPSTARRLASANPSSRGDSVSAAGVSLCEVAMDLVAILDTNAMASLEKRIGSGVSIAEFVVAVRNEIDDARRRSRFATNVRKSEENFQQMLRADVMFDDRTLNFLADSIDRFGTGSVSYSQFVDFLVGAGRRVANVGETEPDAVAARAHNAGLIPAASSASVAVREEEIDVVNTVPSSQAFVGGCYLSQHHVYAMATLRSIEFLDELGAPAHLANRLMMPPDPSATVACIAYAPSLQEIIVGLHNSKVMTFSFDGQLCRSTLIVGTPNRLAWSKPSIKHHDTTGMVLCGTTDGTVYGLSVPSKGVLRVTFGSRLGSGDVSNLVSVPSQDLAVCSIRNSIFVLSPFTGALKQRPIINDGLVRSLVYHPKTGSVAFTHDGQPDAISMLSKRTLKSSGGNSATEIRKERFTTNSAIVSIFLDACDASCVGTMDAGGNVSFWNLATLTAVLPWHSNGTDAARRRAAEQPLRIPLGHPTVVAAPGLRQTIFFGKGGIRSMTRKTIVSAIHDVLEHQADETAALSTHATIALLPCSSAHAAFFGGQDPTSCVVRVAPHAIYITDVETGRVAYRAPLMAAPPANEENYRATAACFGPRGLSVVFATAAGELKSISLEATSLGEISTIESRFGHSEVLQMSFFDGTNVLVARMFDGSVIAAELRLMNVIGKCDARVIEEISSCTAIGFDHPRSLVAVVDSADSKVKMLAVCNSGNRLRSLATCPVGDVVTADTVDAKLCILAGTGGHHHNCKVLLAAFNSTETTFQLLNMRCFGKSTLLAQDGRTSRRDCRPTSMCPESTHAACVGFSDGSISLLERASDSPAVMLTPHRDGNESTGEPIMMLAVVPSSNRIVMQSGDKTSFVNLMPERLGDTASSLFLTAVLSLPRVSASPDRVHNWDASEPLPSLPSQRSQPFASPTSSADVKSPSAGSSSTIVSPTATAVAKEKLQIKPRVRMGSAGPRPTRAPSVVSNRAQSASLVRKPEASAIVKSRRMTAPALPPITGAQRRRMTL